MAAGVLSAHKANLKLGVLRSLKMASAQTRVSFHHSIGCLGFDVCVWGRLAKLINEVRTLKMCLISVSYHLRKLAKCWKALDKLLMLKIGELLTVIVAALIKLVHGSRSISQPPHWNAID